MPERFIIRDEPFGATAFDRQTLRYQYVETPRLGEDIFMSGVKVDSAEHWPADLTTAPPDLLYAPIRVYIETTNACNLRCRHCFNASSKRGADDL